MLQPAARDPVPVFDCHVLLRRPGHPGELFQARCAAAPDVTAQGATEREVLQALVIRFKYFVEQYHARGETIPWQTPETPPAADEVERWIPVHL